MDDPIPFYGYSHDVPGQVNSNQLFEIRTHPAFVTTGDNSMASDRSKIISSSKFRIGKSRKVCGTILDGKKDRSVLDMFFVLIGGFPIK